MYTKKGRQVRDGIHAWSMVNEHIWACWHRRPHHTIPTLLPVVPLVKSICTLGSVATHLTPFASYTDTCDSIIMYYFLGLFVVVVVSVVYKEISMASPFGWRKSILLQNFIAIIMLFGFWVTWAQSEEEEGEREGDKTLSIKPHTSMMLRIYCSMML